MKKLFKNIILTLNIFVAILLFCSYLVQFIPPDKWSAPSLLGLIFPYLFLVNLFFVVLWILIRPRFSLISLCVVILGWGIFSRFVQLKMRRSEVVDMRLVSYNVKNFTGEGRNPSRELAEIIKGFLKENEPDIICLQEVKLRTNSVFNLEETKKEFSKIQHYQYARSSQTMGSVTMTHFPIIKMEEIRFKDSGNIAICTDIVKGKDTIRIFNVHLQSYNIDPDKYDIIESPGINEEKDIREIRELRSKYQKAMELRAIQARLLRKKIDGSPYPVIVCGDFNDTPSSYAYRKTRGSLRDAFIESGKGIGQTYVGKLPSFRIDYILHSREFKSYNFTIHNIRYSDHLPVSCGLVIKK